MNYLSSRGHSNPISAAAAIKNGIATDGGLYVPEVIPRLTREDLAVLMPMTYQERARKILSMYLTDFSGHEIARCVSGAYNQDNFDHDHIAPLVQLNPGLWIQELWHGPTSAFKDMALQILPYLLTVSMGKTGEEDEIVILVATSGDTGKAALEGFRDVAGTRIIVFFPAQGVSQVQRLQMVTQQGSNVHVAAVEGNFDDAQSGVKNIFASQGFIQELADHHMKMSSANSINWGRLLPQIVYYISAYLDLQASGTIGAGDPINIVVPTGNFGNILAAYYAREMGVPVQRLICASNANNVLTDFIQTGTYDRNRRFEKTLSPSMDILISSNLERLLFEITGHDAQAVRQWMGQLQQQGCYTIGGEIKKKIQDTFWSGYGSDQQTLDAIRSTWEQYHYLVDTHTAVALHVYNQYVAETGDHTPTVVASTASPFKFGGSVARAILPESQGQGEFELLKQLAAYTGLAIPPGIRNLEQMEIRHQTVTSGDAMQQTVARFLNL